MTFTKTEHQQRVELLMRKANQPAPAVPTPPDASTAVLRASLILEEALETIEALGVTVFIDSCIKLNADDSLSEVSFWDDVVMLCGPKTRRARLDFLSTDMPNLVEIADGCADISVVTIGTLTACGIPDGELLRMVDENNLAKFGPGHSYNEHGKLIKPPGHQAPPIGAYLAQLAEEGKQ
jgi:predicted HAD superfamily Cof-like phosphohydrolase